MDDSQNCPGEWFDCINVGDDYEDRDIQRTEDSLSIPGHSLVEIVGVRKINEDKVVYEVRLPFSRSTNNPDSVFISSNWNYAFTGPGDILKGYPGRMKFAPAWCRFRGSGEIADTQRIHGRYDPTTSASGRQSAGGPISSDNIFNQGGVTQLGGDPRGHLKLPDPTKGEFISSGWNALGIYKVRTGNKKEDSKTEENLLAYVAPAAQTGAGAVLFITTQTVRMDDYNTSRIPVEFLQYIDPSSAGWNQKYLVDWQGVFGHEFEWVLTDGNNTIGPFTIVSSAAEIETALESLSWIEEGNVSVWAPSGSTGGRWIIEFVGSLSGKIVPTLYRRRVIRLPTSVPENLSAISWDPNDPPPTPSTALPDFNFKPISGVQYVTFSAVSRPQSWWSRWYNGYWYGSGYHGYYYGPYGYYGGYFGGPYDFWGDPSYFEGGYFDPSLAGPYGYYMTDLSGPYEYDELGNHIGPGGTYNATGYDASGYDKDGYNPYGYDVNGLNIEGQGWGYYGRWGHYHMSLSHVHQNDHGVELNFSGTGDIFDVPAGTMGIAVNVGSSGFLAVELEEKILRIDFTT